MATIGRVLGGRYRLLDLLGTGASAQVFLADDETLRRRVAVKVLHPALARDEAFLRRFGAEARAAAALSHPNLLAVYDWGEDDDGPYLVMEHLAGGSLHALLERGERLSPSQALLIGLEAARGLEAAHRSGFVHRDIKPANLLFGSDRRLRIADFGVARALSESGWTEHDGLVGTARYAAPEQARTGKVDGRADVYALALVVVEAVTGVVPHAEPDALRTLMARADSPAEVPSELGPLAPVLRLALRPHPDARPDAGALAASLLEVASQLPRPEPLPLGLASPTSIAAGADLTTAGMGGAGRYGDDATVHSSPVRDQTGPLPAHPRRRRRWPWVVLAAVVIAGAVAGVVVLDRLRVAKAPVPAVAALAEDEAKARLQAFAAEQGEDFDWGVDVRSTYHEVVPEGDVIEQVPKAGTELADGKRVQLVVSKGRVPVDVPELTGLREDEIDGALAAQGLVRGKITSRNDEQVEKGRVVVWSVGGVEKPAKVRKGSSVDVVLSSGPEPRVITSVAGGSYDAARVELEALGLRVEQVEEFSTSVARGEVIGTTPAAGTKVERGSLVKVRVSKGPDLVVVPDVSKFSTVAEAAAALEQAGLVAGDVQGPARGRPYATDPGAGSRVPRGTTVDIYLRR